MVAIGIVLLGVPVWSVTQPGEAPPVLQVSPAVDTVMDIDLIIESSVPCRVEIKNADVSIVSTQLESAPSEATVPIPKHGADLVIRAIANQPGQRLAVRVRAGHDGSQLAEASFWGDGEVAGVLMVADPTEAR